MSATALISIGALALQLLSATAGIPAVDATPLFEQASGGLTAAQAAPFIADWTLALQGPNGPGTFELSVKEEKDKITGEISSDQLPKQPIREISMADKTLVLAYSFTWEGNPVEAVVSLTPAPEGKMTAQIDFAGGAYIMSGTATKKENAKPGE
jgi:hypothetical protein